MKVFLDDIRDAPDTSWVCVRDIPTFLHLARHADEVSLDHDLGENSMTGNDALKYIENEVALGMWPNKRIRFHIHSANPVGRKNMEATIASILKLMSPPILQDRSSEVEQ